MKQDIVITLIGTLGILDLPEGQADVYKFEDIIKRLELMKADYKEYGFSLVVGER